MRINQLLCLTPPPGPGAVLSAHLPNDGAHHLHGWIQRSHHFICAADQQLRMWTRQQPDAQHGVTLSSALSCWVCDMCEPLGAHTKRKDYNLHWIIYQPVISHKHLCWFCRLFLWCNLPTCVSSVLITKVFVETQTCFSFWMRKKMMHVPAQIYETRKKKIFLVKPDRTEPAGRDLKPTLKWYMLPV